MTASKAVPQIRSQGARCSFALSVLGVDEGMKSGVWR